MPPSVLWKPDILMYNRCGACQLFVNRSNLSETLALGFLGWYLVWEGQYGNQLCRGVCHFPGRSICSTAVQLGPRNFKKLHTARFPLANHQPIFLAVSSCRTMKMSPEYPAAPSSFATKCIFGFLLCLALGDEGIRTAVGCNVNPATKSRGEI